MRAVSKTAPKAVPQALSSRTILWWAVGLAVVASGAVTLLWVFLGDGDPASARRLDALRTAASLVVGAGGAAALLLAARRQRYVELDLEQKDHDANERRVTELYGKAADQLGSDKAPVRLAGVYALERLAQDEPRHRQTVVNLLCAYLRMPYTPPADPADEGAAQEQLVRMTVQDVLESHLRPQEPGRFWPDIDLTLSSTKLEFFWFRGCRVRRANFRHTRFLEITAFRDSEFTESADFHRAVFAGTADLRRTAFGPRRANFRDTTFDGDVDFGAEPAAGREVDLAGGRPPHASGPRAGGTNRRTIPAGSRWSPTSPLRRPLDRDAVRVERDGRRVTGGRLLHRGRVGGDGTGQGHGQCRVRRRDRDRRPRPAQRQHLPQERLERRRCRDVGRTRDGRRRGQIRLDRREHVRDRPVAVEHP
jgi:hypothetical protein